MVHIFSFENSYKNKGRFALASIISRKTFSSNFFSFVCRYAGIQECMYIFHIRCVYFRLNCFIMYNVQYLHYSIYLVLPSCAGTYTMVLYYI